MGQMLEITAADGQKLPAYVAQPEGAPRGAVVVLQEIFGVNSHIRDVADGYARAGYLAVAPALFQRVQPGVEMGYSDAEVDAMSDDVLARIEARLGDPGLARRVDTGFLARLYQGFIHGTDGAQRRIAAATLPKLLAAIEDWRQR